MLLVRHHERIVPKDELLSTVWPDSFVSEDSLTQTISALRRALGDDPAQPKFIATIARRGYRFIAPVTEVPSAPGEATAVAVAPPALPRQPSPSAPPPAVAERRNWIRPLAWMAVAGAAVFLLVGVRSRFGASAPAVGPLHFTQDLPPGTSLASGGLLSPDSRYLVFVAQDENSGKTQLWLRALDSADARPVDGTEGASRPFWSPDGQFIGFFSGSKVKRVSVASGPPQTVASTVVARPAGGTWNTSGVILYSDSGSLSSVPAGGGDATTIFAPDPEAQEVALRAPQFLPDGRHFLFVVMCANPDHAGTYVGTLGSS